MYLSLSSDYEDSEEDEESGKDWDELEEEARKGTHMLLFLAHIHCYYF